MAAEKNRSVQAQAEMEALAALRKLGGELVREEDIERGDKFVIPKQMTLKEAVKFLEVKRAEDEEEAEWVRRFRYRPLDGAVATERAIRRAFGTLRHVGTPGFFGDTPPQMIDVEVGPGEKIQVPWGRLEIPALSGVYFQLHATEDPELGAVFAIVATGKKKRRFEVEGLFKLIDDELQAGSIYKGRAIDANFGFLDLSRVERDKVVYAEDVMAQMEASIFAPIRFPGQLKEAGVQLKSAVLLHGTYGVGKTLFAYLTGQECEQNGVTFIQVRPNQDDLTAAMQSARMYAPAVVFFEDLDTIASADEENDHISGLLELFDGVRAKGVEVMAILTTNHADRIHKGMVRPGRLDAVIEITPPDGPGIIKLCKTLVPEGLLQDGTDEEWQAVADAALGYIPAFVHEGCKRAIKYALVRTGGDLSEVRITVEDLRQAMQGLRAQYDLMQDAKDLVQRDSLGQAIERSLQPMVNDVVGQHFDRLDPRLLQDA